MLDINYFLIDVINCSCVDSASFFSVATDRFESEIRNQDNGSESGNVSLTHK